MNGPRGKPVKWCVLFFPGDSPCERVIVRYLPLHDIPHFFLVLYDLFVMLGLELVEVIHLPLQHGQGLSERLQICDAVSARPMGNRCMAILRSFRFMFRISVSRMILLFSRRARSYDDDRSCGTHQRACFEGPDKSDDTMRGSLTCTIVR